MLAGYASARMFPQGWVSFALTILGGTCFVLALLQRIHRVGELIPILLRSRLLVASICALLCLASRLYYQETERTLMPPSLSLEQEEKAVLLQRLGTATEREGWDVQLVSGTHQGKTLRLYTQTHLHPSIGDTLVLSLERLRPLTSYSNQHSYQSYLLSQGIVATGRTSILSLHPTRTSKLLFSHPSLFFLRYRELLLQHVHELRLSPYAETLLVGITLGYIPRDDAGKQLRSEFTSGGVAHLLAVSGFHLAVVVGAIGYILSHLPRIRRRQRLCWVILLLCAWCFTLVTGCAIPTVRAAAMLSLYYGARMLGRPASLPEIIALPALFQLLLTPMSILSASMPLTYLAILSIHLFYRPIYLSVGKIRSKLIGTLWGILALTLSVQPLLLPLSLYLFGYSSLSFLFTALPLTLLASLLIPTFLIVQLLLALGLSIAQPFLILLEWATQMMHSLANAYSSLPFLQIHYTLTLPQLLLIYTLLVLGLIALRLHREKQKTW